VAEAVPFRTIDELATLVGGYCWQENRLFALTGSWAGRDGGAPALNVCCNEMSSHHGQAAALWRDRLPVRAGVVADALVVAPPGWAAVTDALAAQPDPLVALAGLVEVVLPRLRAGFRYHLVGAAAVGEAPVMAVLQRVGASQDLQIARAGAVLQQELQKADRGPEPAGNLSGNGAEFGRELQRLLEGASGISPAARAS